MGAVNCLVALHHGNCKLSCCSASWELYIVLFMGAVNCFVLVKEKEDKEQNEVTNKLKSDANGSGIHRPSAAMTLTFSLLGLYYYSRLSR